MIKIKKPWGHELIWAKAKKYAGKFLYINKGEKTSLHYHKIKDETIFLLKGRIKLQLGKKKLTLKEGQAMRIKPLTKHRIEGLKNSILIEVSTPELKDVIRLKDEYGRVIKETS